MCSGGESNLLNCQHNPLFQHNCQHYEDVAVICNGMHVIPQNEIIMSKIGYSCAVTCVEGSVRLQNPDALVESQLPSYDLIKDQVSRGIVEVCVNQSYTTVLMDTFWNDEDAFVICQQLGFSKYGVFSGRHTVGCYIKCIDSVISGSIAVTRQAYPDNALDSGISQVQCDGSETSLLDCRLSYLTPAVPSPNDAALVCQSQSTQMANCSNGDIRLVNGTTELEGRLEICINNAWGTVCSEGFTADDAKVVCRQLNIPHNGMFFIIHRQHTV